MRTPYPYQTRCNTAIKKGLENNIINQLVCSATGTGKTYIGAVAANEVANGGRILWINHTIELIEQSAAALAAESGEAEIGLIKADTFNIEPRIVMASAQTLHNRLHLIPEDYFDVVVADECHLFGAKTFKESLDYFKPKLRLGLTATPYRMDGCMMGDLFDEIIFEYNIDEAIRDGYLCELDAIRIKTNINLDKVKTVGGDLNQGQLEELINTPERNGLIVEKYIQYCSGRQFIAFCVDVKHAQDLCAAFNERGVKTNFIVGDTELTTDRRSVIHGLKSGEYVGLTNCMVLTAGFDHPNIGCIIEACPTKSLTKYLQQIGRGTRLKDAAFVSQFGQNCIILDFIDNTSKHRLVNTWELDRMKPPEERTFISEVKRLKLIQERKIKLQQGNDEAVILLALPVPKINKSIRMAEPATQKQLEWIAALGYDIMNVNFTKSMCTEIISKQPANYSDFMWLKNHGYDVSNGVTQGEAGLAKQHIKNRIAKENTDRLKRENKFPYTDIK